MDDLPVACRSCLFWELTPSAAAQDPATSHEISPEDLPAVEKESWVSRVLLDWGSCGRIVYVDRLAAGFVLYAPPVYFRGTARFATAPVSQDAVQLATAAVLPEFRGGGLGRILIQSAAKDLVQRDVRALEAVGDLAWKQPACVLPAQYLLAVGFKTVRPHPRFPRMRMDLKSTVSWRDDVEGALERLLGSMSPERALRPI